MGLERERVVEIYAEGPPGRVGSGYLISNRFVLTARHVVDQAEKIEVRPLRGSKWLTASPAWSDDTIDAALLELTGSREPAAGRTDVSWGRIEGTELVEFTAVGFPWAQARTDTSRDTEQVAGTIAPLTSTKAGLYALNVVRTTAPRDRVDDASPWQGMSGAAVFAGPYLIGVIVSDPARYATDRITALPAQTLVENEDFARLVGGESGLAVASVEQRTLRTYASAVTTRQVLVPFTTNPDFAGRDDDLGRLAALVDERHRVGITGMGGIGKTQLAVEFALRYADNGRSVLWINAAEPLPDEFARLGRELDFAAAEGTFPRQVRSFVDHVTQQRETLLVFDNLADPLELRRPASPAPVPDTLRCRILFTTRRSNVEPFVAYPLELLTEDASLAVLLRHPARKEALDPDHPEHEDARRVCRLLGNLPLALVVAGAHLGRFTASSIAAYGEQLAARGALGVLDDPRGEVSSAQLATRHEAAIAATLEQQWDTLNDDNAKLLLQTAAQLSEAAIVPVRRLSMLSGLSSEGDVFGSPLSRAQTGLTENSLAEVVRRGGLEQLQVHPLVRDFVLGHYEPLGASPPSAREFRTWLASNLLKAFEDIGQLGGELLVRGVYEVQEDIASALSILPARHEQTERETHLAKSLEDLFTVLQREGHQVREGTDVATIAQQLHNRSADLGPDYEGLTERFAAYLGAQGRPWIRLRSRIAADRALLRVMRISETGVRDAALASDARRVVAASVDGLTVRSLTTGRRLKRASDPGVAVDRVVVTPNGAFALSGGGRRPGILELWDLETLQRREFGQHEDKIRAISVSADGAFAASADYYAVSLWDLQPLDSGELPRVVDKSMLRTDSRSDIGAQTLRFLDSRRLAIAGLDGHDGVWAIDDAGAVSPVCVFEPNHHFRAAARTPDGAAVVVADWQTIRTHDLSSGRVTSAFVAHDDKIRSVDTTSDGLVVSASDDGTVRVWTLSGERAQWMGGHTNRVTAAAVDHVENRIVSASADGTVRVWALRTDADIGDGAHLGAVRSVVCTADGSVVSAGTDGKVVKSTPDGRTTVLLGTHRERGFGGRLQGVRSFAVEGGRRFSVSASALSAVVYDLVDEVALSTLDGIEPFEAQAVKGEWARKHALPATRTPALRVASGPVLLPAANVPFAAQIAVSPDGSLVIGQWDDQLCAWDRSDEPPKELLRESASSPCVAAAINAEERMATTAFEDGSVAVWDLESSSRRQLMAGVHPVLLFPGGRFAIRAPDGRRATVWDLYDARPAYELEPVDLVGMTEDGRFGVALQHDGTFRFFVPDSGLDADPPHPVAVAIAGGTRALALGRRAQLDIELQSGPVATLGAAVTCRVAGPPSGSPFTMVMLEASPTALAVLRDEAEFAVGDAGGSISVFRYES